ncbi:MAG: STAS domain-containing protein [Limnochordia bacterium]|jgi:anti-sigma B factor antagonist|nr:STAS domain-containing protein [Bacillota bacterium]
MEVIHETPAEVRVMPGERIVIENAAELKEILINLIDQGARQITVDMGRVKTIDSSGLGKLLLGNKLLKELNGKLIIENITSEYIDKMFRLIHLDEMLEIR